MANVWPLAMLFAGLALPRRAGCTASAGDRGRRRRAGRHVRDRSRRQLADALDGVRDVSAFRYYGSAIRDGIDPSHVLVLLAAAGAALAAAGALLFERRDVL